MSSKNKWEICCNNVSLVNYGLFMMYTFIGVYKGEMACGVLGMIFALLFIFNYKPIKEKP